MATNRLELRWRRRIGGADSPNRSISITTSAAQNVSSRGEVEALLSKASGKLEVDWLDFVIDGQSLGNIFSAIGQGSTAGDLIGCLGWAANRPYEDDLIRRLLLKEASELETGRFLLYVCPECGDVGCGAVTATIDETPEAIVWKDFGHEVNYAFEDEPYFRLEGYEHIGPFRFNKGQYRETLVRSAWPNKEPAL